MRKRKGPAKRPEGGNIGHGDMRLTPARNERYTNPGEPWLCSRGLGKVGAPCDK